MAALLGRFRVSRPKPITTAPAPDQTSGTQFVFRAFEVETKVLPPQLDLLNTTSSYTTMKSTDPRYQERWESFTAFQGFHQPNPWHLLSSPRQLVKQCCRTPRHDERTLATHHMELVPRAAVSLSQMPEGRGAQRRRGHRRWCHYPTIPPYSHLLDRHATADNKCLDRHATADNKRANASSEKRAGSTPLPIKQPLPLLLSDSAYAHVWLPIPFFLLPFA
ncbi:hypothetical protein B0H14DRAFT_3431645 [Mycena olivaceomarginata]|nr:hypothetical protein B0H14DRAFT_3431645 [Mycena olivaceomarginata]